MESYLIHSRPKATIYVTSHRTEKEFSCQIQPLHWCQGQKCKSKWRTCNLSLGGLSQEPANSRWENTTAPRHSPCALQQPQQQLGCCWLHCQANATLPVCIGGGRQCLWLCPLMPFCSGLQQGSPQTTEKFSQPLPQDS